MAGISARLRASFDALCPAMTWRGCFSLLVSAFAACCVIESCGGNLTHVMGWPLQFSESLPTLPIVRVIDSEDTVRGVWLGWRPDLNAVFEAAFKLAPKD